MDFPSDCRYTKSHEWVRVSGTTGTCGITAFAAEQVGEVVSVELPEQGKSCAKGSPVGAVESSKASSELYAPVSGKVVDVNKALEAAPEKINESPYGDGWIFTIELADPGELGALLDAAAYAALVETQEEK